MRSCNNGVDIVLDSKKCKDQVLDKYEFVRVISMVGATSNVIEVQDNENNYAIKIVVEPGLAVKEIKIGCELKKLIDKNYTNSFVIPKFWFVCDENIFYNDIYEYIDENLDGDDKLILSGDNTTYIYMTLGSYSINELFNKVEDSEMLHIIFELLYALMLARSILGFNHRDLRADNILIYESENVVHRSYKIGDKSFYISNKYIPMITDYGISNLNDAEKSNDFFALIKILKVYTQRNKQNNIDILPQFGTTEYINLIGYDTNKSVDKIYEFIVNYKITKNGKTIYDHLKYKNPNAIYKQFTQYFSSLYM